MLQTIGRYIEFLQTSEFIDCRWNLSKSIRTEVEFDNIFEFCLGMSVN